MEDEPNYTRILGSIAACVDVDKLMAFLANAKKRGVLVVQNAVLAQLETLIPANKKGSYERAFWDMLLSYQTVLLENGKPTLKLNEAWKVALIVGEIQAHRDWVEEGAQAWAFGYLLENFPSLPTAEDLVLKFPTAFEARHRNLARNRLKNGESQTVRKSINHG
ncbi:MAG: hypothetical protein ACSHXY_02810 [Alphaproteobacteria bacterium]